MAVKRKIRDREYITGALKDVVYLFLGFALSLNLLRLFRIPYAPTHGIENLSSFSPESSYFILFAIIICTLGIFAGLRYMEAKNFRYFRVVFAAIILFSYFLGTITPYFAAFEGNIDTFHHGEQLAPALALEQGRQPYKDLFFLHGAGEDVITPWLSFKLFGQSIGSYYFMLGMLQLISVALFLYMLNVLFKKNLEFMVVALWFTLSTYAAFYYVRDIPVWLSVILLYSLLSFVRHTSYKLAALGLLASLSLFYSFDRGSFLTVIFAVTVAALLFFERSEKGFSLHMDGVRQRIRTVLPAIGGYAAGTVIALALLGFSGFAAFIKMTLQAGRYQGAIFNYPYPDFSPPHLFHWLPILAIIAVLLAIIRDAYSERKLLSQVTMLELILLAFSLLFFRSATGRPDPGHVAYGSVLLFVLIFFIVSRRVHLMLRERAHSWIPRVSRYAPLIIVLLLMFSPGVVQYYRLTQMNQMPSKNVKLFLTSPAKPDSFWTNDRMEIVSKRIQQIAGKDGGLFVYSSEPLFYYTTKLPNPTRFSISWFADAQPLEDDMLRDLKANPPKVVVYESGAGFNDMPDYIPIKDRLPKVNAWLLNNYPERESIQNVTLLIKD